MASAEDSDSQRYYSVAIDALQKATNDTERLSALLVVSNVLKDKPLSDDQNQELFKSIDPKFLCRLLLTTDGETPMPEGCPPYIYQSIGVSIITAFFARIPNDIDSKTWIQLLSSMAYVLRQLRELGRDLDDSERQMAADIIVCFECFFSSDGVKRIDFQTIKRLFDTKFTEVLTQLSSNDRLGAESKTSIDGLLLKIAMSTEWSHFDPQSFAAFMSAIARDFTTTQDKHKFDLCPHLTAIITTNSKYFVRKPTDPSIGVISDTIFAVLRSKLNKDLRDPIVKLAANLTELFNGFQWIRSSAADEWNKTNAKQFLLLLRLSCIEVSMNYESEDIDMSCVANSFMILEHSVLTVANDSEDLLLLQHLTQEEIYDMLTAIRDTMSVIIRYLQRLSAEELDVDSDIIVSVLASIRVVCVWVTEETEALREELADILPFIVRVFRMTYGNRLSINNSILTAFIAMADDDTLRAVLLNERLIEYLDTIADKQRNNDLSLVRDLKLVLNSN